MLLRLNLALLIALAAAIPDGRAQTVSLPAGTPLTVQIDDHLSMRVGQPIRAELVYPVYADNQLILPAKTVVTGNVITLRADSARRIQARLDGDFTPFHIPSVSFTHIILGDGSALPFSSSVVTDGSPIYRVIAPPPSKGGFLRKQFDLGLTIVRDDIAIFLDPGKGDRLKQFVYGQLPYHPERMEKGTSWIIETTAPLNVPVQPVLSPAAPAPAPKHHFWQQPVSAARSPDDDSGTWIIQAYLADPLSSETSTNGQIIHATVAQPIYNPDHTIAIPQGATLVGAVTRARPAHRFGRTGILNFTFRQLTLPDGQAQNVETTLAEADSAQALALDSEGQVKSRPQDKTSIPAILAIAATWSLDQDRDRPGGDTHRGLKNATGGAAGLGLIGTIIGLSGQSPYAAAGIGYYGAALAFYDRWIARGKKITFARDTRIVLETTPRHAPVLSAQPIAR